MATSIGQLEAKLVLDTNNFDTKLNQAGKQSATFEGGLSSVMKTALGVATALTAAGIAAAGMFLSDSVNEAKNLEKALTTLEIIAPRFGESADEAKEAAKRLGKELKIGTASAASSLQNLLKSGLNLPQATELLKRFTNEAITGKSQNMSLAQAVDNLSFAYATNNSQLGNLSGINENYQDIIDKGRSSLVAQGMATKDVTDEMAKYQGMMELTNLTLGSADKFSGTLIDTEAELEQQMLDLKTQVGTQLLPVLNEFLKLLMPIISQSIELGKAIARSEEFKQFQAALTPVINELKRLGSEIAPIVLEIFKEYKPELKILASILTNELVNSIKNAGDSLKTFLDILRTVLQAIRDAKKGLEELGKQYSELNAKTGGALNSVLKIPGFASGTDSAPGGMAWVGEKGPELVNLPKGSQVIPNSEVNNYGSKSITVNNYIQGGLDIDVFNQRLRNQLATY